MEQTTINVSERLDNLIKRRGLEIKHEFSIKERGKLRTSKWFMLEMPHKSKMYHNLSRGMREL